jgi:formylglycine-generating enzyme required for sulfatase activity
MTSYRSVFGLIVVLTGAFAVAAAPLPTRTAPREGPLGPLGMKFAPLPKGTFYMGWDGEKGKANKTEIKADFEIAVHAVTQGQWQAIMGNNPSWFSREGEGKDQVKDMKDEDLKQFPVESVSWNDAQEFIRKLNEKEKGQGWTYRLPTEAEWEYACRGGATTEEECSYHFYFAKPTNDLSSMQANFNGDFPFGKGEKGPYLARTTKVGSYAPNKLGLYDMHGNVWQWCEDLYDPTDPKALARVLRGGGWRGFGVLCRSAYRRRIEPGMRSQYLGFRLAAVPEVRVK